MAVYDEKSLLNFRRTKCASVDKGEGDSLEVNRLQKIRPDKPCHKMRDSILSSSNRNINFTGFMNLFFVLLVLTISYIAVDSILKHGVLFDPLKFFKIFFCKPTESTSCLIILGVYVFASSSLGMEIILSKGILSEKVGLAIITALLTTEILIPAVIFYNTDCHIAPAFFAAFTVVSVFLKLISYHVTNYWCRESYAKNIRQDSVSSYREKRKDIGKGKVEANLVHYPDNLNFKDFYYFLIAPTLCYELNFPRNGGIRKMFLIKRAVEMIFLSQLVLFLIQQCIVPILNNSLKPFQEKDYPRILEIFLNLAVPYMCMFITGTYVLIHTYLNAIAEIVGFGDRFFYDEYWNSESVEDFWQNWNIPVHKWCLRHLYLPLTHRGLTNSQISIVIFFISAVFHEYTFIASLKMFRFWSFYFMIIQIPYTMTVDKFVPLQYGNILAWTGFTIIIPFCNLMYYNDYYTTN